MTRWTRAQRDRICGLCGRGIDAGKPLFEIVLTFVRSPLVRCADCAWSPVPPDLPPVMVEHAITKRFEVVASVAARTVPDFKQRQTGEDDE